VGETYLLNKFTGRSWFLLSFSDGSPVWSEITHPTDPSWQPSRAGINDANHGLLGSMETSHPRARWPEFRHLPSGSPIRTGWRLSKEMVRSCRDSQGLLRRKRSRTKLPRYSKIAKSNEASGYGIDSALPDQPERDAVLGGEAPSGRQLRLGVIDADHSGTTPCHACRHVRRAAA
jgi:hypothetical protein